MAFFHSPNIVTDNLMFHVDAADRVSYYSGSTTWKDLSGNGRDGILSGSGGTRGTIGTVSSSEAVGGAMAFDAGVDQISITSTGTPGGAKSTGAGANAFGNNADISAEAWVKTSNGDGGIIGEWIKSSGTSGTTGNWLLRIGGGYPTITVWTANNSTPRYLSPTPVAVNDNVWHHIVGTSENSAATMSMYVDGNFTTGSTSTSTVAHGEDGIYSANAVIGKINGPAKSTMALIRVYDKTLSVVEVRQNFNAQRGRFGV